METKVILSLSSRISLVVKDYKHDWRAFITASSLFYLLPYIESNFREYASDFLRIYVHDTRHFMSSSEFLEFLEENYEYLLNRNFLSLVDYVDYNLD